MASHREQKEQLRAERLKREAQEAGAERRRRLIQYASAAAFLAVCVVAVLIVVSQTGGSAGSGSQDAALVSRQLQGIPQHGTVLGSPKAPVTVVEFGDLQCPVCRAFSYEISPKLISDLVRPGTAKYEFRNYTIIGSQSTSAAKAALAASEQDRYWNFIELFYRNQGPENSGYVTDAFLTNVAKGAGIPDIAKWNADRSSAKWDAVLSRTKVQAEQLGFNGTPSILVEGPRGTKPFPGSTVPSLAQIEAAVKAVQ